MKPLVEGAFIVQDVVNERVTAAERCGRRRFVLVVSAALVAASVLPARTADHEGFVDAGNGVRLFYREQGRGDRVVVLHGGPGLDQGYLAPDLEPLARGHRLLFFDQRGSGRSTIVSEAAQLTADALVADLERLRERIHERKLTLLGHSWGAGLAALYAMKYPAQVRRLLLVGALPPRAVPYLRDFNATVHARLTATESAALASAAALRQAAADQDVASACRAYWKIFIRGYYAEPNAAERAKGDVCNQSPAALRNGDRVNTAVWTSLGAYDWRDALRSLKVPALLIHGDRDPIPLDAAREWALPNARLLVVADSGHMPFVEQPAAFFRAAEDFLRGRWPEDAKSIADVEMGR